MCQSVQQSVSHGALRSAESSFSSSSRMTVSMMAAGKSRGRRSSAAPQVETCRVSPTSFHRKKQHARAYLTTRPHAHCLAHMGGTWIPAPWLCRRWQSPRNYCRRGECWRASAQSSRRRASTSTRASARAPLSGSGAAARRRSGWAAGACRRACALRAHAG